MRTSRDAEIVAWIGSLGAAGTAHVMERFGLGQSAAYGRLRLLAKAGLLRLHQLLHGQPGLYTATRAGLRSRGLEHLGVCRLGPGAFEHAWEIASAAARLEPELSAWDLLSERALRARERDEGRLLGSVVVGRLPRGGPALHRPDLLLLAEGRAVAVEVELSVKAPVRLSAICLAYARARHLQQVFYLASPPAARALQRAVRETRAQDRITVIDLGDEQRIAGALAPKASQDV